MNKLLLAAVAATWAGTSSAQDLNRLQLHNGIDVLWLLQDPYVGAPVDDFDPTGDLYWKSYPADALQRCSGTANLMAHEANVFDQDFFTGEVLWAFTVTESSVGSDGTIIPIFTGAGVFVPGTSVSGTGVGGPGIFGSAGCPPPGYVSGWVYTEFFINTATGLATPIISLTADGNSGGSDGNQGASVPGAPNSHWVHTHFFPAPGPHNTQSVTQPPTNGCGGSGDATFQWAGSTDGFGPIPNGGENQPDWTGAIYGTAGGNSIYGGFGIGGSGTFSPIPEVPSGGADQSWFFDEMTVQFHVDTDNGDGFDGDGDGLAGGPELGLAALETPLQISSGGVGGIGVTRVGITARDKEADTTGLSALLQTYNLSGGNLLDVGIGCLPFAGGGQLAMNPADPAFSPSIGAGGTNPYDSSGRADSNLAPAGTGSAWQNLSLDAQGHTLDLLTFTISASSNVTSTTLRFNDGL